MSRKPRGADARTPHYVEQMQQALREALDSAKWAGCPRTAEAIRRAIKSADGARRHLARRKQAQNGATPSPVNRAETLRKLERRLSATQKQLNWRDM